jgi:ABC-type glutathione transport system ATPase component
VDADILLIDEILAVGDAGFQEKCFEKLKEIKVKGTTVVIVSHVMGQLESICDRVLWLEDGRVRAQGSPGKVSKEYLMEMEKRREEKIEADFQEMRSKAEKAQDTEIVCSTESEADIKELPEFCTEIAAREGSHKIYFTDAAVRDADGKPAVFVYAGKPMEICMKYHADFVGEQINFVINITRDDGVYCFGTSALSGRKENEESILSEKDGRARILIEKVNLLKGRYLVDIGIQDLQEQKFDYIYNALEFRVKDSADAQGIVDLRRHWELDASMR